MKHVITSMATIHSAEEASHDLNFRDNCETFSLHVFVFV